jgi:hypothetical protein
MDLSPKRVLYLGTGGLGKHSSTVSAQTPPT